jgi:hypothetical protein
MPKLKLISLVCTETEDNAGADEAYIRVNGNKVWGPKSINTGQSKDLSGVGLLDFQGSAKIELFDEDVGGPFDRDDFLGEITATEAQAGQGTQNNDFNRDDANYTLFYEVLA